MEEKTCKNCIYLFRAENNSDTFICTNKHSAPGRLFVLTDEYQPCRNYFAAPVPRPTQIQQPADGSTRFIPLTKDKFAIVDSADFDWLNSYKWHAAVRKSCLYAGSFLIGRQIYMHRLIMNPPPGLFVDHIDGNGLNNKRSNLRLCTPGQNVYNCRGQKKASKYKGVYRTKNSSKWRARIAYSRKNYHLGYFDNEIDAALAYDKKASELFGQFAHLNFPNEK